MKSKIDCWDLCNALHLSWQSLERLVNYRLKAILNRDFNVKVFMDGDYWELNIRSISQKELNTIFNAVYATREERIEHKISSSGCGSISENITLKLIKSELPFTIEKTMVHENGIVFLGKGISYAKQYDVKEV